MTKKESCFSARNDLGSVNTISRKEDPVENTGIVALFFGEGWGKSAASYGYAIRSMGRGWETSIIQFVKGRDWNRAEASSGEKLGIEWLTFTDSQTWGGSDPNVLAEWAWQEAVERMRRPLPSLIVLDEITNAVTHGWISADTVVRGITRRATKVSVLMTGRDFCQELADVAEVVTRFDRFKDEGKFGILAAQ